MKGILACAPGAAVLALLLTAVPAAQFRASLDVVEVYATVRTSDGAFASQLTRDDFELFDNGKPREITVFSSEVQPTAIAMLLDRSGSLLREAEQVSAAAVTFLDKLLPDDRVSLSSLTWDCLPLTKDKVQLADVLRSGMANDSGSPVWGGTNRAISSVVGEGGRRAVLLFSDGDDFPVPATLPAAAMVAHGGSGCKFHLDTSLATLDDVVARADREGVLVYAVSVDNAAHSTKDGDLRRVARESGGERYRLQGYADLSNAFARIADELHHQYLLGFVPDVFDGKRHEIEVRVKRPGVTVRSRKSYVAVRIDRPGAMADGGGVGRRELSAADIESAIAQGAAGQKLQAGCTAPGVLLTSDQTDTVVQVTLEGPLGRVMRLAREAKARRETFAAGAVTADLRALVLEVTAEVRVPLGPTDMSDPMNPTPTPSPTPTVPAAARPPGPSPIRTLGTIRLRSREMISAVIEPLPAASAAQARPGAFAPKVVQRFDLAAFDALPAGDIEVVVQAGAGVRRCSIPAKDRRAIR